MAIETTLSSETSLVATPRAHPRRDLFLLSFLILFIELACIRWFGSNVAFLTFFTNIVLMASFLGMSIGLLSARRPQNFLRSVIPLLTIGVVLSVGVYMISRVFGKLMVDVGQRGSAQQVYFGSNTTPTNPFYFVVPIEVLAGAFFLLIASTFIGLGQAMGRAFDSIPNRVVAYSIDVLGSLLGILVFGLCSYFRLPPYLWFALGTGLILTLVPKLSVWQLVSQGMLLALVAGLAHFEGETRSVVWSPYYKVEYWPNSGLLVTNGIGHQLMVSIDETAPAYSLPHLMARDAGLSTFDDVMIIGAGSGNDVAAALAHGARHVDAVEIEPVLNEAGRRDHPKHPYDDPRVTIHLDDGRSYARKSTRMYDLIQYALVDSLVLHSGYSSIRLESFLFTEQAFRDIKARLKPDGVFMTYNYYREGWVVGRIEAMAEKVFGRKPLVISLPYKPKIDASSGSGGFTFVMVGNSDRSPVEVIRRQLEKSRFFWANAVPRLNLPLNGYGPHSPANPEPKVDRAEWLKIGASEVDTTDIGRIPTDDWPFLYLRSSTIPALNIRGMVIIGCLSLAMLLGFAPMSQVRPNGQMFFLGAGFMLLETKSVVHMALLFGSTWTVNSIVFFAILVMILLSNLYVLTFRPKRLWPYYSLLIAALALNALVPMSTFLALEGTTRMVVSCLVVFAPVFFAGVIFATSFRDSTRPEIDFGFNVGGVILGGLSENLSLALGFDHLLFVAIGYYLLSALLRPRSGGLVAFGD